jgi:hypothetical protein
MNIIFENLDAEVNFVDCPDVNRSGFRRFAPSPMITSLFRKGYKWTSVSNAGRLPHYIIATGVNHNPNDWAGAEGNTILDNLSPVYLTDLQNKKALLIIDQSLEGYQTPWLWEYFHRDCEKHNVDPRSIVYVTGNSLAPDQYSQFCISKDITKQLKVIAYEHFNLDVQSIAQQRKTPLTWKAQIKYKKEHPIKTYNCLNKRLRPHRIWFYTELYKHGLLQDGLVSMNPYKIEPITFDGQHILSDIKLLEDANKLLPLELYGKNNTEHSDNFYIRRILDQVYLDSWVSVVSEPIYADADQSVFCSEKIFKSIASFHPFIIVGGRGSLKRLQDLGFKTFDGFIDETYDTLPSSERFGAIINALKKINNIEDKLKWVESMEDILVHNYNLFMKEKRPEAAVGLETYYREYFNVRHFFHKLW